MEKFSKSAIKHLMKEYYKKQLNRYENNVTNSGRIMRDYYHKILKLRY